MWRSVPLHQNSRLSVIGIWVSVMIICLGTQIPERVMVQQCTHVGLETNSETEKKGLQVTTKDDPKINAGSGISFSQQGEFWPVLSPYGS